VNEQEMSEQETKIIYYKSTEVDKPQKEVEGESQQVASESLPAQVTPFVSNLGRKKREQMAKRCIFFDGQTTLRLHIQIFGPEQSPIQPTQPERTSNDQWQSQSRGRWQSEGREES
jgi:hypothetical protein